MDIGYEENEENSIFVLKNSKLGLDCLINNEFLCFTLKPTRTRSPQSAIDEIITATEHTSLYLQMKTTEYARLLEFLAKNKIHLICMICFVSSLLHQEEPLDCSTTDLLANSCRASGTKIHLRA